MATANIDLADGTKIVIDGSPDEIARLLQLYKSGSEKQTSPELPSLRHDSAAMGGRQAIRKQSSARGRESPMNLIRSLIREEYFAERRSIASVQSKLEEMGHIYPQTHLSTPLRRLVKGRELRRLKDSGNWVYVGSN